MPAGLHHLHYGRFNHTTALSPSDNICIGAASQNAHMACVVVKKYLWPFHSPHFLRARVFVGSAITTLAKVCIG